MPEDKPKDDKNKCAHCGAKTHEDAFTCASCGELICDDCSEGNCPDLA